MSLMHLHTSNAASGQSGLEIQPQTMNTHIARMTIHAYVQTQALERVLERFRNDRMMARSAIRIVPGGMKAAIEAGKTTATPDILMVEAPSDPDVLKLMPELARVLDPTNVLVFGDRDSTDLMRELQVMGVHDYFAPPFSAEKIIASISRITAIYGDARRGRAVAFFGAKGGTGASALAMEAALDFAGSGHRTLLIDLDLGFGTLAYKFGREGSEEALASIASSHELDAAILDNLALDITQNLSLLAPRMPLSRSWTAVTAENIETLLDAARRNYERVVIDLGQGWHETTTAALLHAEDVVTVLSPDLQCLDAGKRLLEGLQDLRGGDGGIHVVINNTDRPKRKEPAKGDYGLILGFEPAALIPHDPTSFPEQIGDRGSLASGSVRAGITVLTGALRAASDAQKTSKVIKKSLAPRQPSPIDWLFAGRKRGG